MKIVPRVKGRSLMLVVALFVCLGSSTQAAALQRSYLLDLASKKMIDLGTLGGNSTIAYDMNDAGQVVGYSVAADGVGHAFMTGADGIGMRDLGILFPGKVSVAHAINDAGRVVLVSDYGGEERSFITGPNGVGLANLGSLSGGDTRATAINNAGQVAGWSGLGAIEAFITGPNGEGMTGLGGGYSQAWDINEAGQVAGTVGDLPTRAFITGPNGEGMTVLGTLGGYAGWGWAINDAGQVAGDSTAPPFETWRPFITGPSGLGMRDLGAIGGDPTTWGSSRDINDAGRVDRHFGRLGLCYRPKWGSHDRPQFAGGRSGGGCSNRRRRHQ